jgi:hypothetical protein
VSYQPLPMFGSISGNQKGTLFLAIFKRPSATSSAVPPPPPPH